MHSATVARHLTPADVAERLNCRPSKVRDLINSGQLPAINAALNPRGKKPRWQITMDALEAFERGRMTRTPAVATARPRKQAGLEVIQFFT